jgi:hypothetical protein
MNWRLDTKGQNALTANLRFGASGGVARANFLAGLQR